MDFLQPAFYFLKAVFVFVFSGRWSGRRSRRDSFLSFQSLLADAVFIMAN
jgi:predicted permease